MKLPDFAKTVTAILKRGWTQDALALECGVRQSTIGALANGKVREPFYGLGAKLLEMNRAKVRPRVEPRKRA